MNQRSQRFFAVLLAIATLGLVGCLVVLESTTDIRLQVWMVVGTTVSAVAGLYALYRCIE